VQLYVCLAELTALPYASWLDFGEGEERGKRKRRWKKKGYERKRRREGEGRNFVQLRFFLMRNRAVNTSLWGCDAL